MEKDIKQVIVMRKDLNMRRGKQIAQGAHASMKVILDLMSSEEYDWSCVHAKTEVHRSFSATKGSYLDQWLSGRFKKICVYVDSEEDLLEIVKKARDAGMLNSLILDSGLTEFGGVPTHTCCAIGPHDGDEINKITGHLKLL
jgi:PTH2 family peptidyl-tRNA hydrolase